MGESVIMRDKYVEYNNVDYEGDKDLFRIELKYRKWLIFQIWIHK